MARVELPPGDTPEIYRVWALQPEMGAAVGGLAEAVYEKSQLPPRVREAARMRMARINECQVCLGWRIPELAAQGVTEELYAHVEDRECGEYSVQEQLAIEYAEKYALDHLSIDDAFFARMREHFTDAEILDLTICIGNWLAFGRLNQVFQLDVVCDR